MSSEKIGDSLKALGSYLRQKKDIEGMELYINFLKDSISRETEIAEEIKNAK